MSEETSPSETLSSLRTSLSLVEETLKPLLEKKWSETTTSLGTLERAKMDVLVSYAINDLIWVYLKMKGVDPSSHDVSSELERISTYYAKVQAIEEPESRRTTQIDKGAAGRIISNSIPKRQRLPPTSTDTAPTSAAAIARKQAEAAVNENMGTSSRFRHIARDEDTERVVASNREEDDGHEDEEEGEDELGDEAEDLLNDLQEQYLASQGEVEGVPMEEDPDRKKRKRAEDLNR